MDFMKQIDERLGKILEYAPITETEGQMLLQEALDSSLRSKAAFLAHDTIEALRKTDSPLTTLTSMGQNVRSLMAGGVGEVSSVLDGMDDFVSDLRSTDLVVPTPFPQVNANIGGGLRNKSYLLISSTAGGGKTTLASYTADYAASCGYPVLYISMEMAKHDLIERSLARIGNYSVDLFRDKENLDSEKVESSLATYLEAIAPNMFIVEGGYDTTPAWIASAIAQIRARLNLSEDTPFLVVIDYVQLLNTGIEALDTVSGEAAKVSQLAQMVKNLARDSNVAVFGISDITKEEYAKSTKNTGLSLNSLRGSSRLGHSADIVLFLYSEQSIAQGGKAKHDPWAICEENLGKGVGNQDILEKISKARSEYALGGSSGTAFARLEFGKNRTGACGGSIPLIYHKAYHRMSEI